ncbi:hypothetical protein KP78_33490 [Jeotgalibacillus soli]|uniref:Competence protein ComGF n=1 Tax=Jeotgalibacillus soli TaxID=889306 RepID=A0A0C2R271_9BACL|nr:hypothetical protein KP78_33490 [Jeotgalibacillus soli]
MSTGKRLVNCALIMMRIMGKINKNVSRLQTRAFTFIEVIFCLSVLIIIASLMPLIFLTISNANDRLEKPAAVEWDLFLIQFRQELTRYELERVEQQRIILMDHEGNRITFSSYRTLLRRQVNGTGHEVFLTAINSLNFTYIEGILQLEVVLNDGSVKNARFVTNLPVSEGHRCIPSSCDVYSSLSPAFDPYWYGHWIYSSL